MRRFWCAFWEHAHELPCENDAYVKKLKSTAPSDVKTRLAIQQEHQAAIDRDKTRTPERLKQEFWRMFDGFCAHVSNAHDKEHICENPIMLKAKRGNHMPPISGTKTS